MEGGNEEERREGGKEWMRGGMEGLQDGNGKVWTF